MTVGELKELLFAVPDDMEVLIPLGIDFDGLFFSPCVETSGELEMGDSEDDVIGEESFLLVPCGFFEESDEGFYPELN